MNAGWGRAGSAGVRAPTHQSPPPTDACLHHRRAVAGLHPLNATTSGPSPALAHVTVTTAHGLTTTFEHTVLFTGRPRISGLAPAPSPLPPCAPRGARALADCPADGTAFAISGAGLLGYGSPAVTVGPFRCPTVTAHNATYLTCEGLRGHGAGWPVVVEVPGAASAPDPAITVSFLDPCEARHGPCSHHGVCLSARELLCSCHRDALRGFWGGESCAQCLPGYYGPACTDVCPGGACTPCSGHGDCDGGTQGTGRCVCWASPARGYWRGVECAACAAGYYGPGCALQCPGSVGVAGVCGGHGRCADGLAGNGTCDCDANVTAGFWAGPGCAECRAGYFGAACARTCPDVEGAVCGGHGACTVADPGTGACACDPGFVGVACAVPCPGGAVPCGGHGECREGAQGLAECVCGVGWVGALCTECGPGFGGWDCSRQCPVDCGGHGTCDDGPGGSGRCTCDPGWGGERCTMQCPGVADVACGGHGACDANATCICMRSPTWGFWAGAACGRCAEGYAPPDCAHRCPTDAAGAVCSGRGECRTGRCACDAGACGPACGATGAACAALVCPDATHWGPACLGACPRDRDGAVCGGHGICESGRNGTGYCLCAGAWSGPDCEVPCPGGPEVCHAHGFCHAGTRGCACLPGFVGPDCARQCPGGWQTPCSAHGVCSDTATCACDVGYTGDACQWECPGGHRTPCHGHGRCVGAANASWCACVQGWAGAFCDACAAGWHGPGCRRVCLRGATHGTICECEPGWAGPDCDVPCQRGPGGVCGGHGVCNDTRHGDGTCACDAEWRGAACGAPCPGVASTEVACSGHGACLDDATCRCDASRLRGHWAGPECGTCASGWLGSGCDRTCPTGPGSAGLCGGHGQCQAATETCVCARDAELGFWADKSNCTECLPEYYGPDCRAACPGGACGACSGHGVCDAGRAGSGACACDAHWRGTACSQCDAGWYGLDCGTPCPAGWGVAGLAVCSGRGQCLDGVLGSGACVCPQSPAQGFWTGAACDECLPGHFGPACAAACPGPAARPCNAPHGACDDGRNGTGRCVCGPGYGGAACEGVCPTTSGEPCDGRGACDDGAAGSLRCDCGAAPYGHWAGAACERCAAGWTGARCDVPCPISATGAVCGGHGVCVGAAAAVDDVPAVCRCDADFAGLQCDLQCPGGIQFACYGHGTCDPATAACTCFRDPVRGHWGGAACRACAPGWSGPQCLMPCPLGAGGVACSGAGQCYDGFCTCGLGRCGPACEETAADCLVYDCPPGRYGYNCSGVCPGGAQAPCTGHGFCQAKVYGTGVCHCAAGYAGVDCGLVCPGAPGPVCAGHGVCGHADARCTCDPTYAGADCRLRCPIVAGRVCAGHGECNSGAAGNGACVCAPGYGVADCSAMCPRPAGVLHPCGAHGECDARTATCKCDAAWAGADCGSCAAGLRGPACTEPCVHGATVGQACSCDAGYGGRSCERECPGPPGQRCYGHGACRDGNASDATCACDPDYYGPDCWTFCRPELCFPEVPRTGSGLTTPHAQCGPGTGQCECQDDRFGHWGGAVCTDCDDGFWGAECDLMCLCGGHGMCGRLDGVCRCHGDAERGFWVGEHCTACAKGYLAPACRVPDVAISRTDDTFVDVAGAGARPGRAVLCDAEHALAYAGGQPLWVVPTAGGPPVAALDLGGPVHAGAVLPDGVLLLVRDPATAGAVLHKIARGPAPGLVQRTAAHARAAPPRYRVQAVPDGGFSAVYAVDGAAYMASLDAAEFTVLRFDAALATGRELRLPAASFPLRAVRSGIVWERRGSAGGPALLLSGARGAGWGLVAVPLASLDSVTPLSDAIAVPECAAACDVLAGTVVLDDVLVLVLQRQDAIVLGRVRVPSLANLSTVEVLHSTALDWVGAGVTVTATIADALTHAAFIAAHAPEEPSVVYKVCPGCQTEGVR